MNEEIHSSPFEGPEKLLEIWFKKTVDSTGGLGLRSVPMGMDSTGGLGLRSVPREKWEEMLDIVRCKVLSVIHGTELDAYLLRYVHLTNQGSVNNFSSLQRIFSSYLSLQTYSQDLWDDPQPSRATPTTQNSTGRLFTACDRQVLLLSQKLHVSRTTDWPSP
jgi:hypothetical protein